MWERRPLWRRERESGMRELEFGRQEKRCMSERSEAGDRNVSPVGGGASLYGGGGRPGGGRERAEESKRRELEGREGRGSMWERAKLVAGMEGYRPLEAARLIRLVRGRRPLWDRKHAYYHDRTLTMGLWAEVAAALRSDCDSVRAKWKGLRDTFRGELKKVNKAISKGKPCQSTQWEYFEDMQFVKDQIYSNKRSLADMINATNLGANLMKESSNDDVDMAEFCKTEVLEGDDEEEGKPKSKILKIDSPNSCIEPSAPRVSPNTSPHPSTLDATEDKAPLQNHPTIPTDDDYSFLMSILPQLRSLPTTRNLFVRLKIQELLYHEIVALQGT